jgi:hypothetical protein
MKWFRSNIRGGARLALFALVLQFALSFGHFHGLAPAQAAPVVQSSFTPAGHQVGQSAPVDRDTDHQPADACAICVVIAMTGTMLFATPPLLLLPQAIEFLYLTTGAEFVHLKSAGVAFQSRAPPLS